MDASELHFCSAFHSFLFSFVFYKTLPSPNRSPTEKQTHVDICRLRSRVNTEYGFSPETLDGRHDNAVDQLGYTALGNVIDTLFISNTKNTHHQ